VYGRQELVGAGEIDSLDDISRAGAPRDERRMTVERAVPEPARLVVSFITRQQKLAAQARAKILDVGR
jgi:hypothetical protein